MRGLSGRYHMGWLGHRLGTPKLMSCSAGPGCGHKTYGTQRVSPGDAALQALHLQALQCQEPAQPSGTNWKSSIGDHFKEQSINNLSCKETAE